MSAGAFERSRYLADTASIYNVKIQPETAAANIGAVNAPPAGAVTAGLPSAQVGASRRTIGVHCRGVRVQFTGTPPTGYKAGGTTFIPILTPTVYAGISKGTTGTYLGAPVVVTGKVPERIN